jgi:hypothetical protein
VSTPESRLKTARVCTDYLVETIVSCHLIQRIAAAQHDEDLARPGGVRVRGMHGARGEAQLVDLGGRASARVNGRLSIFPSAERRV